MLPERLLDRVRRLIAAAGESLNDPADVAAMSSLLQEASAQDAHELLAEFFDVEPVTLALYALYVERGPDWGRETADRLVEALVFCGYDREAHRVMEMRQALGRAGGADRL